MELEIAFEMMGESLKGYGRNKSAKCPLAPWTHSKGKDKHPSLTATDGEMALFRCWACSAQGSVKKLAKLFGEYSGDFRAYQFICDAEGVKSNYWKVVAARKPSYDSYKFQRSMGKKIEDIIKTVTEDDLRTFKENVPKYALERGMTPSEIDKWEIGYDPKEKRMIIPVRDKIGALAGVSGRTLMGQKPKYKHYYGFKKEKVLYGERFIDLKVKRGFIVEGFFDVIGLSAKGVKNVLATMGTSLSEDQMTKLSQWFREVVILPDMDKPGLLFAAEIARKLFIANKFKIGVAGVIANSYNDNSFRYLFEPQAGLDGKDPSDWTKEEIESCFNNIFWMGEKK